MRIKCDMTYADLGSQPEGGHEVDERSGSQLTAQNPVRRIFKDLRLIDKDTARSSSSKPSVSSSSNFSGISSAT